MEFLKIAGLGLGAAVGYGMLHDQITVRVCIEYFTIGHPHIIESTSPTVLALVWGVVATWWVGLPLGLALALAARVGPRPPAGVSEVAPRVMKLLLVMAGCAVVAGVTAYLMYVHTRLPLGGGWWEERLPDIRRSRFFADLWAHRASYLSGIVGGITVVAITYRRRKNTLVGEA